MVPKQQARRKAIAAAPPAAALSRDAAPFFQQLQHYNRCSVAAVHDSGFFVWKGWIRNRELNSVAHREHAAGLAIIQAARGERAGELQIVLGKKKMPDIGKMVLNDAARDPKPAAFLETAGGAPFLLAQFFTIFATILGVYLAGYVGFQRTLEYDRYTKAQQQADLLTGVSEELRQNIERLRKFHMRLPDKIANDADGKVVRSAGIRDDEWPRLRQFIWQSAGRSNSFFDTPPQTLTDLQAFYEDIGEMFSDAFTRDTFGYLWAAEDNNVYYDRYKTRERPGGAEAFFLQYKANLDEKLKYAETTILPAIQKSVAEAQKISGKYAK